MYSKELMFIERSLIASSLIENDWISNSFKNILKNSKNQLYYNRNFMNKAPEKYQDEYRDLFKRDSVKRISEIKEKMFFKTGDFELSAEEWLEISTDKVDAVNLLGNNFINNIEIKNIEKLDNNIRELLVKIALILFFVLIYLCLILLIKEPKEIIEEVAQ